MWFNKGRRAADSGFPLGTWGHHAARRLHAALTPFLAVASVIPVLRNVAPLIGKKASFALDFVVWIGFILSWASAITQLNLNLWWAGMLLWGGLAAVGRPSPDNLYARENAAEGGAPLEIPHLGTPQLALLYF